MPETAHAYRAETNGITVTVTPHYLEQRSDPEEGRYVWAYQVEIANMGKETVQLRARHWIITNAVGHQEEVLGPGVVGDEPVLTPGDSYSYMSGCPLNTPSGMMMGTYEMERQDGSRFDVIIPAFFLDSPHAERVLN